MEKAQTTHTAFISLLFYYPPPVTDIVDLIYIYKSLTAVLSRVFSTPHPVSLVDGALFGFARRVVISSHAPTGPLPRHVLSHLQSKDPGFKDNHCNCGWIQGRRGAKKRLMHGNSSPIRCDSLLLLSVQEELCSSSTNSHVVGCKCLR